MTNYILIDSKTRAPVPLPYETTYYADAWGKTLPARITGFSDPKPNSPNARLRRGSVTVYPNGSKSPRYGGDPLTYGLELITEADFMAERS